jgi:hypothetical protein
MMAPGAFKLPRLGRLVLLSVIASAAGVQEDAAKEALLYVVPAPHAADSAIPSDTSTAEEVGPSPLTPPEAPPPPAPPQKMPYMNSALVKKFVVISKARCGTTWLATMMNSHPGALMYSEFLSENQGGPKFKNDGLQCSPEFRLKLLQDGKTLYTDSNWDDKGDPQTKITNWFKAAEKGATAIGFKFFNEQGGIDLGYTQGEDNPLHNAPDGGNLLRQYLKTEKCFTTCRTCSGPHILANWIKRVNAKVIILERRASVAHILSQMIHSNSDEFKCDDAKCAENAAQRQLYVDVHKMNKTLRADETYWNNIGPVVKATGAEVLTMPYRQLCQDPKTNMDKIFKFIGIDTFEGLLVNGTEKMNTKTLRRTIKNDLDVEQLLKDMNSGYEDQLDEIDSCR